MGENMTQAEKKIAVSLKHTAPPLELFIIILVSF